MLYLGSQTSGPGGLPGAWSPWTLPMAGTSPLPETICVPPFSAALINFKKFLSLVHYLCPRLTFLLALRHHMWRLFSSCQPPSLKTTERPLPEAEKPPPCNQLMAPATLCHLPKGPHASQAAPRPLECCDSIYFIFNFFLPVLLRYSLHTALYKFKVYSIMIWPAYIMKWWSQVLWTSITHIEIWTHTQNVLGDGWF